MGNIRIDSIDLPPREELLSIRVNDFSPVPTTANLAELKNQR